MVGHLRNNHASVFTMSFGPLRPNKWMYDQSQNNYFQGKFASEVSPEILQIYPTSRSLKVRVTRITSLRGEL